MNLVWWFLDIAAQAALSQAESCASALAVELCEDSPPSQWRYSHPLG